MIGQATRTVIYNRCNRWKLVKAIRIIIYRCNKEESWTSHKDYNIQKEYLTYGYIKLQKYYNIKR